MVIFQPPTPEPCMVMMPVPVRDTAEAVWVVPSVKVSVCAPEGLKFKFANVLLPDMVCAVPFSWTSL